MVNFSIVRWPKIQLHLVKLNECPLIERREVYRVLNGKTVDTIINVKGHNTYTLYFFWLTITRKGLTPGDGLALRKLRFHC